MASVRKRTWTHKGEEKTAWVVAYTDLTGKRRLKTFKVGQKKAADRYSTKVETEIEKGIHTADSASITVDEAAELWLKDCEARAKVNDKMSRGTVQHYRYTVKNYIRPMLGKYRLTQITGPIIQRWVNDLRNESEHQLGPGTIHGVYAVLRETLTYAERFEYIGRNVAKTSRPRLPEIDVQIVRPSRDEVRRILNESTGVMKIIAHIAILAGLREGEILTLTWNDVDFDENVIRVRKTSDRWGGVKAPKTKAGKRDVTMSPMLGIRLKEWALGCPITERQWVFPTSRKHNGVRNYIGPTNFYSNLWRPFLKELGFVDEAGKPRFHFHALRHAAASLWIEQGISAKPLTSLMGHASVTITYDRYGYLFKDSDEVPLAMARIDRDLFG